MNWKKSIKGIGILALVCLMMPAYTAKAAESATIAEGITVDGIDIGGMTKSEAEDTVRRYVEGMADGALELAFNGAKAEISMEELGFEWENPEIVSLAAECGQEGNILERYKELTTLKTEGKNYTVEYHIDEKQLEEFIQDQAVAHETKAMEAVVTKSGKLFQVTESADGLTVNRERTNEVVFEKLYGEWSGGILRVDAATQVLEPKYKTEELEQIRDCLGSYTTPYNEANRSRSVNLVNAAHFLDGQVLLPGESLSLYDKLYPCTEENGYQSGIAYAEGGYVDSIGGGICQVSTTMYNALLLAEVKVVTRAPHSMTVSYVEPGFDSAQSAGSKDLSFRNDSDYPIYVEAYAKSGTVYCAVWGMETRSADRTVRYYNNILSKEDPGDPVITEDPSLPAGTIKYDQDAYYAIKVELYKEVSEGGKVVETKLLHTDRYQASPAKIRVGTKVVEPAQE